MAAQFVIPVGLFATANPPKDANSDNAREPGFPVDGRARNLQL
jgi:hypothetical protein